MDTAKELGITIIAYSPLAQGLVTGKFHDNPELLKKLASENIHSMFGRKDWKRAIRLWTSWKNLAVKYGSTPSQVALNWLIQFIGDIVVAIPGATKAKHAEENTGAMRLRLSAEDMRLLDEVSEGFKK